MSQNNTPFHKNNSNTRAKTLFKAILIIVLALIVFVAVWKSGPSDTPSSTTENKTVEPDKATIKTDDVKVKTPDPKPAIRGQHYYAEAPNEYAARRCKLDVFLPKSQNENSPTAEIKKPVIVFFHGGGLTRGFGNVMMPLVKSLLAKDIAVVTVDYRLAPEANVPDFIEDAAASVSWVLNNAEKIGVNPDRIFCGGYSAGGYLAAMVIQDKSYMAKFGQSPDNLAGLVAISGQMITHRQVRTLQGLDSAKPIINKYAPVHYANAKSIPTLCIVGDNDNPARLEENLYWMKIRELAGNESDKMIIQKGRTHRNIVNRSEDPEDATNKAIIEFIKTTTKPVSQLPDQTK